MTCSHRFTEDCDCDDAPEPSIEDIRVQVHHLVNGRAKDGHPYTPADLDKPHFPKSGKPWTLRESLAEEAEALVEEYGLNYQPRPHSVDFCEVCLQPGCFRCADDDAAHAFDQPRPVPDFIPPGAAA